MQFIFDNIIATIVGGLLILVVGGVSIAQQRESVSATRYHATMQQQLVLRDMIERDFENVGAGVPIGEAVILQADDEAFVFRKQLDDGTQAEIAYLREGPVDSVRTADAGTLYLYQVVRTVTDRADRTRTERGQPFTGVLRLEIGLDPFVPADLDRATSIAVSVEAMLAGGEVQQTGWGAAFRPHALNR